MIKSKTEEKEREEKALVTFLEQTKEGRYAKIDKNSLTYSRVKEQRELNYADEEYFYSLI